MKKLLTVLMVTMVVLGLCTFAVSAEQLVDVTINGVEVDFDVPAQVINDRTLVPLRGIFEVLGAQVNWDNDTETVTASKGDIAISLQIGSTSLFVNGEEKVLDVPAQLVNDRTLIPARAVAESFGATVDWDDPNQTVIITDPTCPDFKAMLDKALADDETTVKSFEGNIDINFAVTSEEEAVNLNMQIDVDAIMDPEAVKVDVVADVNGEKFTATVYNVEEKGKYVMYVVAESADEKVITKQDEDEPLDFTVDESADLSILADYAKISAQDNGASKYVFTVTGKQINDVLAAEGFDVMLAEAGIANLFADDSELDFYLWINNSNGQAYKFNLDFVNIIEGFIKSVGVTEGITIDSADLDFEITGIDTVKNITVPDDVKKNAVETTSLN